jgi:hypothetical protein
MPGGQLDVGVESHRVLLASRRDGQDDAWGFSSEKKERVYSDRGFMDAGCPSTTQVAGYQAEAYFDRGTQGQQLPEAKPVKLRKAK